MKYDLSIFIFTRDLRLNDNSGLIAALKESKIVIPIFIFNPKQIDDKNKYKSNNCVQFMCQCLDELDRSLQKKNSRLYFFYDDPIKVIENLIKTQGVDAVYINTDYTPFAQKRENDLTVLCKRYGVDFFSHEDYLLTGKDMVTNSSGKSYVKFTPFYRAAKKMRVRSVSKNNNRNYLNQKNKLIGEYKKNYHHVYQKNNNVIVSGGRSHALTILKNIKNFKNYSDTRDHLSIETTHLSAYLKFNVISIREVYHQIKNVLNPNNKLLTQLYWRDFYMIVMYHHPYVIGGSMKPKNNSKMKWDNNKIYFKKWCLGKTGFPIVDAAMRQLNTIGWMHNRGRMIVSNFLIKILRIDWQWGERYFSQNLVDYDPANNNGGWLWNHMGVDSQPYFRYFNPFTQSKKFDEDCLYIKKWIPELRNVDNDDIHHWDTKYMNYSSYPAPIISDIAKEIQKTIKVYRKIYKK